MADKLTKLKVWQKEISKAEWEKEVLGANSRTVGFNKNLNKYYRVDMGNAEYVKYLAAKKDKKVQRIKAIRARSEKIGFNKGMREGVNAFKHSTAFEKIKQAEFNKGVKSAKPKQNLAERAAKLEAKAKEIMKKADAVKAKMQG